MNIKEQLTYKNIKFKNRLVMPPMASRKADENGHITDSILKYYDEKTACGLFAAVIVEHSFIAKQGMAHALQVSVSDDSAIEGLSKLAKVIKNNGALAILQISHAGGAAKTEVTGMEAVSASAIQNPLSKITNVPVELTTEDIEKLKHQFIQAAIRGKQAGFDGVEIHSAHGYLLNQFLSPVINHRKDEYGGDIYGRIKLHLDIIKGIKAELGEDYPLFLRMGAGDFIEGGLSQADAVAAALAFEKAGVDVLDISGGMCFYSIKDTRPGYFDVISKPIYEQVQIPVILTGGVQKGRDIEDILNRQVCDLVGIGRQVMRDSKWMNREVAPIIGE